MIELLTPQRTPKTKDEDLYKSFVEMIKIEHGENTSVFIELNDSRNIDKLINAYIDFTDGETVQMLVEKIRNSIQNVIQQKIIVVNKKIIQLRDSSEQEREHLLRSIQRYEEATQIATRLGIQDTDEDDCSSYIFREPNYCIGFRKLNIELEFLNKRKFIDPKISTLHELEQKIALLQTLKIEEEGLHAVSIYKSAHQSKFYYEIDRIRIIAIVALVGLFSGIFLVYFVAFVENQREKYSA